MSHIKIIQQYLEKSYQELYGDAFNFSEGFDQTQSTPSWLWVDEQLSVKDNMQEAGVVVDPELGTCLFILPFQEDKLKSQIAKALSYRSKLLFEYAPITADKNGMWKIMIHWYVEHDDFEKWATKIADIRRDSSQIEEIPVDAIMFNDEDILTACEEHRFPRLLINTRMILSKTDYSEIEKWSSANDKIKSAVTNAANELEGQIDKKLLEQIFSEIFTFIDGRSDIKETNNSSSVEIKKLHSYSVKNFRNINHLNVTLTEQDDDIVSSVLHGPNGTGKSSLFEALSFGIGKTSKRFNNYLKDKNHNERNSYRENYLNAVDKEETPSILINDETVHIDTDHDAFESSLRLSRISGTFLSQEQTGEFTKMDRQELGSMIIGQSSTLALALNSFLQERYNEIREQQKTFLKKYSINASVKRIETASEKIVDSYLETVFVRPDAFLNWLAKDSFSEHPFFANTLSFRHEWELFIQQKDDYLKLIIKAEEDDRNYFIRELLIKKSALLTKSHDFYKTIEKQTQGISNEIISDLQKWAQWLQGQQDKNTESSSEATQIKQRVSKLQKELEKVIKTGIELKARIDHIETAINFMQTQHWVKEHHDECPTCGSNLSEREGAEQAITALFHQSQQERETLLVEYKELSSKIKTYEARLIELGEVPNPVSHERQNEIRENLLWLLPKDIPFLEFIGIQQNADYLIGLIQDVQLRQPTSERTLSDDEINAIALGKARWIEEELKNIQDNFAQERAWTNVNKTLQKEIASIVNQHLPDTFQALWIEIAKTLTPAPWQYRGNIQLDADTKNKQSAATVDFVGKTDGKQRLAHYILNGAEIHVLGLAWFFTRYLTYGRFQNAFIVLDDPAQEMDQHTFKDLCRFFEILVRLHKVKTIPLTLITMLHQDERAIELVRTLNGLLHQLRWNSNGDVDLTTMKLLSEEFKAPYPTFIGGA